MNFKFYLFVFFSCIILPAYANHDISKMNQIAAQYETDYFNYFPEASLIFGRQDTAQDRFSDHSMSALQSWQKKEDHYLRELSKLNAPQLKSNPAYSTYPLLVESLQNNRDVRVCREELWSVNPMFGWHIIMGIVAQSQPVGNEQNRTEALNRWQDFGLVADEEIKNLKLGLKQKYSAPKPAVERVIKQLDLLLTPNPEDSPFFDFAKRDGDPLFMQQVATLILQVINPAIRRYRDFLSQDYLPNARNDIGVWSNPNGDKCYTAKIKQMTTLSISAEKIYGIGLKEMARLEDEVSQVGQMELGTQDMNTVFQTIKNNPIYFFKSEQDMLDYNFAALARAQSKVAQWFDIIPKTPGTIQAYPYHRAITGAAGEYHPSEDQGKPGIFYINTYQADQQSRASQEATLFHELIPGHHFQVSLTYENKSRSGLDKYLFNAGFVEGWALYAERLADEMGLYSDNISRLGMLSNEAFRAARLVVDTGIHAFHWTREQAIQYLQQHSAFDDFIIEGEVDRYIMMPGQATSYMLGKIEIESLRALAKQKQGSQFDIRQFHNVVLKNGTVTLPMLREQVESWLNTKITPTTNT